MAPTDPPTRRLWHWYKIVVANIALPNTFHGLHHKGETDTTHSSAVFAVSDGLPSAMEAVEGGGAVYGHCYSNAHKKNESSHQGGGHRRGHSYVTPPLTMCRQQRVEKRRATYTVEHTEGAVNRYRRRVAESYYLVYSGITTAKCATPVHTER